ncbi:beta-glucoside-specific PTS transporter subunit IIABC [Lactobacillus sp. ESL0731]|uniref:beta-glucoside-specific PTS transporter subunit IIABC n=1 Tax=unclassified Lactobacillus TaxID=2620435 RepID=UPI0023F7548F|nr:MULTISPECIES: beta-glucoside-specific PTS transporter subunit IIABC [unclassified Lactobacillus]WEV51383.1 beta-glucoside-specific PTS transporter subunit IIABC [Lactobacillus sp. ESL0700]WEV62513.1 beta-glucoside-specific PTS transporter subunit IIABC [Lactobacillus sp. ESL0731]
MDYQKIAQKIMNLLGNKENIDQATHCSTRLRVNVNDIDQVNLSAITEIDGVVDAVYQAGQVQVVIGTDVAKVYDEFVKLLPEDTNSKNTVSKEKKGIFSRLIEFIAGSFTPILPVIIGGGLLKGFIAIFVAINVLNPNSMDYKLLSLIADASFQFLPVLLAYTSAKKLKANPFIAVTLAGVLLHPTFAAMVASGHPLALFGLPIRAVNYGASVIPILLIVYVQSKIEKWLNNLLPATVAMFVTPTVSILVNTILGLIILGPIGGYIGDYLGMAIAFLNQNVPWLAPTILGAFSPLIVMMGMHYSLFPIALQSIAKFGYDSFFTPSGLSANMAQAGAGFAVAVKNKKARSTAISTSLTALLGITEPVLYGVNLKFKKALIAAIIGGACGGLYAGLTFVTSTAMASPGVLAIALFAKTPMNLLNAVITMVIAFGVSFVIGLLLLKDNDLQKENSQSDSTEKTTTLTAITEGEIVELKNVADQTFANGTLGNGIAFNSTNGDIYAPVSGKVTMVFPTKHALGITTPDGIEILLHLGINTVELQGQYFTNYVDKGSSVKQGQKIAHYDVAKVKAAGYDPIAIMIITNSDKVASQSLVTEKTTVKQMQDVLKVKVRS